MSIGDHINFFLIGLFLCCVTNSAANPIESKKNDTADIKIASIPKDSQISTNPVLHSDTAAKIRGLIKSSREANLSTIFMAKITQIAFKEGEQFKKGEKLIQFDCNRQIAQLKAAEAEVLSKRMVFENNEGLSKFDAVGLLELEVSKVQLEKSLAELNIIKAGNQQCQFRAPWNGRVAEVKANAHEVVEPGREIMRIIADETLEIEMIVPSNWLQWIKTEIVIPIIIDETGKKYLAEISRIGAHVDPVSQTIRIFAHFKDDTKDVLAGMSGTVYFILPVEH